MEYTLNFESDSTSGRSGCNSYWFDYKIIEDSYDPGDGGFIDPGRYHTTSVDYPLYGIYLRKAFRYEYLKYKYVI